MISKRDSSRDLITRMLSNPKFGNIITVKELKKQY